ncbi:hypothetical protein KR044_005901 [Drosophila immigrans]|nr:hypothetical protein KR044_005901 [Drosophila immigrans]
MMRGRGRCQRRGRKPNTVAEGNDQLSFDNYEDPLDLDDNVQVKSEVFADDIVPECDVIFGMMSSQELLEDQRRMLQGTAAIDERNIVERLGCLERKVDFLLNLNTKILARVDKLCETGKEVMEPTEFPIKSRDELEAIDEKIANSPDKYIELFKSFFQPFGFEKHIGRIFDEDLIAEMNFDGVSSKIGLSNYANLNSALFEAQKKEGFAYADYRKSVRTAFLRAKNRIYKSASRRKMEKSLPTPAKRAMVQKEESQSAEEEEDDSNLSRMYKTISKSEKSMPKPAKRVMLHKEESPPADEELDRFECSSPPMDFVKNDENESEDEEAEFSPELGPLSYDFPIKDKSEFEAVEKKISCNRDKYVELFKYYLKSGGFEQNIGTFFDENLAIDMSYDGHNSKVAFSNYVHFNIALFESQKSDEFTYEDYKKAVRNAFIKCHKRPKKRSDKKK